MPRSNMIASLILTGALATASGLPATALAGESRLVPAGDRPWLTIPQVHERLQAAGYRNIEQIERENGSYEVRATDSNGSRSKLYVNPQTGELLVQRAGKHRRRNSADCNERRCRDDLP